MTGSVVSIGSVLCLIVIASNVLLISNEQALLDLLIRPEYIQPLREEIEQVLAEEPELKDESGMPYIPKSAYAKLRKLDSFIKESQRFHGLSLTPPPVECTEDITFSNGLKIPKGTRLAWPTHAIGCVFVFVFSGSRITFSNSGLTVCQTGWIPTTRR